MSKIATAKQTGQGGISFEDKVAAYYLACMLSQTLPFNTGFGLIKQVSFQVRQDGWLFDDLLLTLETENAVRNVAISIKSNRKFTSNGCPQDINRQLWEQKLNHGTNPIFNSEKDALCLVEAPILPTVSSDLNRLLSEAGIIDPHTLHSRIFTDGYYSRSAQLIYKSFYCPQDLAALYNIKAEDTPQILRCFFEQQMDFENMSSKDESRAIYLCQTCLGNATQAEAERLFSMLCLLPRKLAPVGGSLDWNKLVTLLKRDFKLRAPAKFEGDWNKIFQIITDKFLVIPDKLGGVLSLDKAIDIKAVCDLMDLKKGTIISGISGCGKTNLAKLIAETKRLQGIPTLWLDSVDFDSESIENLWRLNNLLVEIVENVAATEAFLFIDGIERLFHQRQYQKLGILLSKTLPEDSAWKIVITCPGDQIEKVNRLFSDFNLSLAGFSNFSMPDIRQEDIIKIAAKYSSLDSLLFNNSMKGVRNNLKLLDKLIRNADNLSALYSTHDLGESHLVDFIWTEEVESPSDGLRTSAFLKHLAELQADNMSIGVKTTLFTAESLSSADMLRAKGFLKVAGEKIYFTHDLFSDWARYRQIKAYGPEAKDFFKNKDLSSPLWARAIRLFGISLLEQDKSGIAWKSEFERYKDQSSQNLLLQDLLLEAFFFAPDSYSLLKSHKDLLFSREGNLLKRITKLFLLRATAADEQTLKVAKELGVAEELAISFNRTPIISYWPGVLQFLSEECDQTIKYDLDNVVAIASCWLEKMPVNFPFRQEASSLSLKAASHIVSLVEKGRFLDEEVTTPVYKAMLLGFRENTESIKALCLRICKRNVLNKISKTNENNTENNSSDFFWGGGLRLVKREPWPLGPKERVSESFRKACLDTWNIYPIIETDPSLATEILLAVLIEEPDEDFYGSRPFDDRLQIVEEHGWYPPFYLRGPFMNFLRLKPLEGLNFVCQLTNFATDRWLDRQQKPTASFEIMSDNIVKEYMGDFSVFGWHKDIGNAPHTLVSALMAVEQFFYEELDKGNSIAKYIQHILSNSNSIALIGLLLHVGKYDAPLFLYELKPLLSNYEFYEWDNDNAYRIFNHYHEFSKSWKEKADIWQKRPHRNLALRDVLLHLIFNDQNFQKDFELVREKWSLQLKVMQGKGERDVFLYQLLNFTNSLNYEKVESTEGIAFRYIEPKEATDYLKDGRAASLENLQEGQMAYKMQMMLEKQLPFDIAGAVFLWNKINSDYQKVNADSNNHCSGEHAWSSLYTNILSGIKVLLHHKSIWFDDHPEYFDWIITFSIKLIDKQFEWDERFEVHGTELDWNVSLAAIIPALWHQDTANATLRRLVAGVLMLFNNKTTKQFFLKAADLFSWDDKNFIEAQNLLLLYSSEAYKIKPDFETGKPNLQQIRNDLASCFVEGKVSSEILDWSKIRSPEEWKPKETDSWYNNRNDRVRRKGLSTYLIQPLFEVLPALKDNPNIACKSYIISLLDQGMLQVVYQLGEIKEDSLSIRSLENEFDRAVLRKTAQSILSIEDSKERGRIWQSLLKFGYIAPKFIETFCNAIFLYLDHPGEHHRLGQILNEMIEFTYTCPTWASRKTERFKDFRICVLGFHPWITEIWKHDYSDFTTVAAKTYTKWFIKNKLNHHVLEVLLKFITTASGKFMLKTGLQIATVHFEFSLWSSQQTPPEGKVWVGNPELDTRLALTVGELWQRHALELKADKEIYQSFRKLILYLIAIKNVVGIELQNALIDE